MIMDKRFSFDDNLSSSKALEDILKSQRFIKRKLKNLELYSLISVGVFAAVFIFNRINCSKNYTYELKTENVIGNEEDEKFYEIDNKRIYLEIDGKLVEYYFNK